jgi:hypothetical protein
MSESSGSAWIATGIRVVAGPDVATEAVSLPCRRIFARPAGTRLARVGLLAFALPLADAKGLPFAFDLVDAGALPFAFRFADAAEVPFDFALPEARGMRFGLAPAEARGMRFGLAPAEARGMPFGLARAEARGLPFGVALAALFAFIDSGALSFGLVLATRGAAPFVFSAIADAGRAGRVERIDADVALVGGTPDAALSSCAARLLRVASATGTAPGRGLRPVSLGARVGAA